MSGFSSGGFNTGSGLNTGGASVLTGDMEAADLQAGKTGYANDPNTKITGTNTYDADTTVKNILTENQSNAETDTTGFLKISELQNEVLSRDVTEHWEGASSLKVVTANISTGEGVGILLSNITAGLPYTASFYTKGSGTLEVNLYDSGLEESCVLATENITLTGSWTRYDLTITPLTLPCYLVLKTDVQQAATFYIDGLQLEQAESATAWQIGQGGAPITAAVVPIGYVGFVNGVKIVGEAII